MNKLFNELSAVALATALVAPAAVAMGKNDSGVKFSSYSGVGLYSNHQVSGAFWGGLAIAYYKSSDISLNKLSTEADAAKQTGTLKKFSIIPSVSYYIGDGFFTSFDLMIGKHTMEITPSSHVVRIDGGKGGNASFGVKARGVALKGNVPENTVHTVSTAAESDSTAAKARLEGLSSNENFVYTAYGTVAETASTGTADSIAADPVDDSALSFKHTFNTIQPVFGVGYTTAMMDNADEVSFMAKLQLAYTGKGKVKHKSGAFTHATAKDGSTDTSGKQISTELQENLAVQYDTDDFKKNSQKKAYFFGAKGFAPALEVSVGFSF